MQSEILASGFGGAFQQDVDSIAGGPGEVEDRHLDKTWRGISGAVKQNGSDAGTGEVTGDDEREILINGGCVEAGILDDMAGPDANRIVSRQGLGEVNRLDVVKGVGGRCVGNGIVAGELVATVEGSIRTNDLKVQAIYQRGKGASETGAVGVGQGDLERLVGTLHEG